MAARGGPGLGPQEEDVPVSLRKDEYPHSLILFPVCPFHLLSICNPAQVLDEEMTGVEVLKDTSRRL